MTKTAMLNITRWEGGNHIWGSGAEEQNKKSNLHLRIHFFRKLEAEFIFTQTILLLSTKLQNQWHYGALDIHSKNSNLQRLSFFSITSNGRKSQNISKSLNWFMNHMVVNTYPGSWKAFLSRVLGWLFLNHSLEYADLNTMKFHKHIHENLGCQQLCMLLFSTKLHVDALWTN